MKPKRLRDQAPVMPLITVGDGVSDVNSGGAGGAEDAGEGSGRRECGWEVAYSAR